MKARYRLYITGLWWLTVLLWIWFWFCLLEICQENVWLGGVQIGEFEKHTERMISELSGRHGHHQQLLCMSLLYSDSFHKQTKCPNPPSRHCWEKRAECLRECITKQFSPYFCSHTLTKVKQGMCVKAPEALQRDDQPPWPGILFTQSRVGTSCTLLYKHRQHYT